MKDEDEGPYTYPYPRPMLTVDAVVFSIRERRLHVLLIRRGHEPFKGMWALPGGFLDMDEELEDAATRELEEETALRGVRLEQFHTFGTVGRDPRGRVITVAYFGIVDGAEHAIRAGDDAADVGWLAVEDLPRLTADHNEVIARAMKELRIRIASAGDAFDLLPPTVALGDLRVALGDAGR